MISYNFSLKTCKMKSRARINVGGLFNLIRKYEEFSKTNFGAFTNGVFMGVIETYAADKAEPNCVKSKFWGIVECFVGGADATLDTYYKDMGGLNKIAEDSEKIVNDAQSVSDTLSKDANVNQVMGTKVQDNSIKGWLSYGWDKFTSLKNLVTDVQKKLTGYWTQVNAFLNSPLMKGLSKVGSCAFPLGLEELKTPILNSILTFLGLPFAKTIAGILSNAPLVYTKLKELFTKLKTTLTASYATPLLKYYNYGKAVGDAIQTFNSILNVAKTMKRYKHLF
jgi:Flp pilus assembly pilin Flp